MKRNPHPISDAEQIARYAYVLGNVPASVADRAYAAAFARLSSEQRRELLDELSAKMPTEPRAEASVEPEAFALLMRDLYARDAFVGARGAGALAALFVTSSPVVGYFTTGAGSVSIDQHPPWLQVLAGHDTAPLDAGRMHHRKGVDSGEWFGPTGRKPLAVPRQPTDPGARDRRPLMVQRKVGYFVGSLSSTSINRTLSKALIRLAPKELEFAEIPIGSLPLYSPDFDADYPPEAVQLKEAIAESDAVLFITPEYNRSIPGVLKNAIDWASRPYGENSFDHIPAAVIGASVGSIGTAVAQQSLRGVLSYCNARQMSAPEAYIQFSDEVFASDGEVKKDSTAAFLRDFMGEFHDHIERVLAVLPRE